MSKHSSDSTVQKEIGKELVKDFFKKLGAPLEQDKGFSFGVEVEVEIDGYSASANPPILCEAWVHCGKPKGGNHIKL